MKSNILFIILVLSIAALTAQPIPTAGALPVDTEILKLIDTRKYTAAVIAFKGINLSQDNSYLTFSIPLLIKEKIVEIKNHYLPDEQKTELRKSVIRAKINEKQDLLEKKQEEREKILYKPGELYKNKQNLEKINKEIEKILAAVKDLREKTDIQVAIPDFLPIEYYQDKGETNLTKEPDYSLLSYAQKNNIDLLITGSIEEVSGYLFINVVIFDSILKKDVFTYRNIGEAGDIYNYMNELDKDLISIILGRQWANLAVKTNYEDASILVNDSFAGFGRVNLKFIEPGTIKVKASYQGLFDEEKIIELKPYESGEVEFDIKDIPFNSLLVTSNPAEAFVYINGVLKGTTPLTLTQGLLLKEMILKKEGYNDFKIYLANINKEQLMIDLVPDSFKPKEIQEQKRLKFYSSFGLWFISLPVAMILNGYAADMTASYLYLTPGTFEYERLRWSSGVMTYTFYGSVIITAGLLVMAFNNLMDYIHASDNLD